MQKRNWQHMSNDDTYTIKEMIAEFRQDTKESLTRIENQTVKTNGRVTKLEQHRAYLWGAYTILVLLGGTIIAFAVAAIDSKIQKGIQTALDSRVERVIEQ